MFYLISYVCWLVVWNKSSQSVFYKTFPLSSPQISLCLSFVSFYFCFCHFFLKMSLLKFFLKGGDGDQVWKKRIIRWFFPGLSSWVNIDGHRNKRFQDWPWPFFILSEYDNDKTELVSLNKKSCTSWLKEVYENLRLLTLATPLLPISFLVYPSRQTSCR